MKVKAVTFFVLFVGLGSSVRAQRHRPDQPNTRIAPQTENIANYGCSPSAKDNTVCFQKAIDAAAAKGGVVYAPPGIYKVNGPIQTSCDAVLCIPWANGALSYPLNPLRIIGVGKSLRASTGAGLGSVITSSTRGVDNSSAIIGVGGSGSPSTPHGSIDTYLQDIAFVTTADPTLGCLNLRYSWGAVLEDVDCSAGGWSFSFFPQPTHQVTGIYMPMVGNDTTSVIRGGEVSGYYTGYNISEHTILEGPWANFAVRGFQIDTQNHSIWGHFGVQGSRTALYLGNSTYAAFDLHMNLEFCPRGSTYMTCKVWEEDGPDVYDPNEAAHGILAYNLVSVAAGPSVGPLRVMGGQNLTLFDELTNTWNRMNLSQVSTKGPSPTCTTTGVNQATPATCSVSLPGSNDDVGIIYDLADGNAASSGTVTLNFPHPLGANYAVCTVNLANKTGTWNPRATVIVNNGSTLATTFSWDNNGVALTSGKYYAWNYTCFGM